MIDDDDNDEPLGSALDLYLGYSLLREARASVSLDHGEEGTYSVG